MVARAGLNGRPAHLSNVQQEALRAPSSCVKRQQRRAPRDGCVQAAAGNELQHELGACAGAKPSHAPAGLKVQSLGSRA